MLPVYNCLKTKIQVYLASSPPLLLSSPCLPSLLGGSLCLRFDGAVDVDTHVQTHTQLWDCKRKCIEQVVETAVKMKTISLTNHTNGLAVVLKL